jgi:hypothetical protein
MLWEHKPLFHNTLYKLLFYIFFLICHCMLLYCCVVVNIFKLVHPLKLVLCRSRKSYYFKLMRKFWCKFFKHFFLLQWTCLTTFRRYFYFLFLWFLFLFYFIYVFLMFLKVYFFNLFFLSFSSFMFLNFFKKFMFTCFCLNLCLWFFFFFFRFFLRFSIFPSFIFLHIIIILCHYFL